MGRKSTLCQKDKLVLLGTADPTRGMAPYGDADYEIWGCGVVDTYPDVKRLDALFEMHPESYWKVNENILKRIQAFEHPIYMHQVNPEVPQSVRYPIETVNQYRVYQTSSISYMMALAYHSFMTTGKPKRVEQYGIHMAAREEYQDQRPCCEYWAGRMEAAGMDIQMAPGGALLMANGLYGYEKYDPVCWDLRQHIFGVEHGIDHANAQIKHWEIQRAKNEGALFADNHWLIKFQRGEMRGIKGQEESGTSNPYEGETKEA